MSLVWANALCNFNAPLLSSDVNKTKMLRPRPRPIKQQQDYIGLTEKLLCNTHVCYQKITLCKKRQKWYDDQLRLALFLHLLHEKIQVFIAFHMISACHTAPCRAQQCWKQDQKYKTKTKTKTKAARPRPQDRGRSETSLAIRPRSQTPRLLLSARNDVMAASLQCDDKSKIRLRQSMSNHAKYNFDPIWNDVALDIFEEVAPTKTTTRTRRRRRVAIKDQFLI